MRGFLHTDVDAQGHGMTYGYDGAGNQTLAAGAAGEQTTTHDDALNRPDHVTQTLDGTRTAVTRYTCDAAGNQLTIANAVTSATCGNDAANRRTAPPTG